MDKKEKIVWIDMMKGIGMLFVLVGHITNNQFVCAFLYSFHMPLFFLISGYLCNYKKKCFIKEKVKSLIVPYLFFSILTFIYWFVVEQSIKKTNVSAIQLFFNIFLARGGSTNYAYNAPMWFLPCLFVTEVVFYWVLNIGKNNRKTILLMSFLSFVMGYIFVNYIDTRLLWSIDTMSISIVFFSIGFVLKNNLENITSKLNRPYILAIIVALVVIGSQMEGRIDMASLKIPNYLLFYVIAFAGCIMTYIISLKADIKWIKWIGTNSLIIMCIHGPIMKVVIRIISIIINIDKEVIRNNVLGVLVCLVIILITMLPFIKIIDRYFLFFIGKRKLQV